jgi:hypothetical protein
MAKTKLRVRSRKTQEAATWKAFSKYIRTRDCIRTTGTLSRGVCFSCGNEYDLSEAQAGHVISRAFNAALYNPAVVYFECRRCNLWLEGAHVAGFFYMEELYGYSVAKQMCLDAMNTKNISYEELEDIEDGCNAAVEILENYYEGVISNRTNK